MPLLIEGRTINLRTLRISDAYSIYENAKDREISKYTRLPHPYRLKYAYDFMFMPRKLQKENGLRVRHRIEESWQDNWHNQLDTFRQYT